MHYKMAQDLPAFMYDEVITMDPRHQKGTMYNICQAVHFGPC